MTKWISLRMQRVVMNDDDGMLDQLTTTVTLTRLSTYKFL